MDLMLVGVVSVALARFALLWRRVRASRADESSYARYVEQAHQYRAVVRYYLEHPDVWSQPPPTRTLYVALGVVLRWAGAYRGLVWLSTASGAVTVAAAAGMAHLRGLPELAVAVLVGTSPLVLGMGRRALNDVPLLACQSLSVLAIAAGPEQWMGLALALMASLLVKESGVMSFPAIGWLVVSWWPMESWLLAGLTFTSALLGWWLVVRVVAGVNGLAVLRTGRGGMQTEYSWRHGHGGLVRLGVDLFLVSPLVLLSIARTDCTLGIAAVLVVLGYTVAPGQSVRFVLLADVLLRIAVAATVPWWGLAALVVADLVTYWRLWWRAGIYDPTTSAMIAAWRIVR